MTTRIATAASRCLSSMPSLSSSSPSMCTLLFTFVIVTMEVPPLRLLPTTTTSRRRRRDIISFCSLFIVLALIFHDAHIALVSAAPTSITTAKSILFLSKTNISNSSNNSSTQLPKTNTEINIKNNNKNDNYCSSTSKTAALSENSNTLFNCSTWDSDLAACEVAVTERYNKARFTRGDLTLSDDATNKMLTESVPPRLSSHDAERVADLVRVAGVVVLPKLLPCAVCEIVTADHDEMTRADRRVHDPQLLHDEHPQDDSTASGASLTLLRRLCFALDGVLRRALSDDDGGLNSPRQRIRLRHWSVVSTLPGVSRPSRARPDVLYSNPRQPAMKKNNSNTVSSSSPSPSRIVTARILLQKDDTARLGEWTFWPRTHDPAFHTQTSAEFRRRFVTSQPGVVASAALPCGSVILSDAADFYHVGDNMDSARTRHVMVMSFELVTNTLFEHEEDHHRGRVLMGRHHHNMLDDGLRRDITLHDILELAPLRKE
eukprot:PhM_4_TR4109/c1_g1_i1/m.15014